MPLLFTDPRYLEHETGPHPESPERLRAVHRRLEHSDVTARYHNGEVRPATPEQIAQQHTEKYIDSVRKFAEEGGIRIENDTFCSEKSFEVARLAAGAGIAAVDGVMSGDHRRAACLVRPPGHHARPTSAMGFCLFNNIAIAAAHARAAHGLDRVLIVDWDVHHGNGTQEMFYDDEGVYFLSVHRWPFYPGTGDENETGSGAGSGTIFNLPLAIGVSRDEYRKRFATLLRDAAERCRPELVLLSAGFDAHSADPIGSLGLETEDFETLTKLPMQVADEYCGGRLVSLLEGGYNVEVLADCVECHLDVLSSN